MTPVSVRTEVDRPAEVVFTYATDPTYFREWQTGVVDGHMDATDQHVGSRCSTTRRIGVGTQASTSEVTHIDPPRTWRVRGIDGPIRAQVDLAVDALDDHRSRITITVDFEGHGIGKLLIPLIVRRQAAKEMPSNMAALKRRLEDQVAPA